MNFESNINNLLLAKINTFESLMDNYHHHNLRTFQFFLSKVNYLLTQLNNMEINANRKERIQDFVITKTFDYSIRFKANYQPSKDEYVWISNEQKTKSNVIKNYVE